jgi:hypothetical protein
MSADTPVHDRGDKQRRIERIGREPPGLPIHLSWIQNVLVSSSRRGGA